MRIRTTAAAVITAGLLLTGCSSSDETNDKPSKPTHTTTAPTTAPAKLSKAEITSRCVDALVDQAADDPSSDVGATRPEKCAQLDDSEYADAVLDATQQANQAGRDQLQDEIDEAIGGAG
ncbi:hypothetical protein ACFV1F_16975 [Streptomyces sp. NPDC059590]|uniref:hypothetical protein n=1 Tax=Streptomyces sp. NPDC059590 TaxID=3346877 RepID=UPI0036CC7EBA